MTEEQKKKCEEIINSYEEKYNKDLEEALSNISNASEIPDMPESEIKTVKNYISILLFWYDKSDSTRSLHLEPIPQDKAKAKFFELLAAPKDKTVENVIDLAIDLSEVFGNGMTKEEAEKLLFTKKSIEIDGTLSYLNIFTGATEEFRKIMKSYEKGILECENYLEYIEEEICSIKNIGEAIANYFDSGNKEVKKENKNKNINKINNVVENTAKEKIMSNNDELTLNLLILGKTGVGKSSLLNALVGEDLEKTGIGKPETPEERKNEAGEIERGIYPHPHEIDGKKVVIYDSWGLEVDKATKWEGIIEKELKKRSADKDIKDWFHSVTYCIQAGGNRIEDFDAKIIKKFIDKKYNVIVALTKADHINEDKEEEFINTIKKETGIDTVISISAKPERKRGETETPKPFGLPEYKAAILISWRKIFIDRIPLHIIEKLKEDIENAKSNAPKKGKVKELTAKIQKYFSDILNTNIQKYVRENIEKYYKVREYILTTSKNIEYNFNIPESDYTFETVVKIIAMILFPPIGILIGLLSAKKSEKINEIINEVSKEYIKKISGEEFESEIRKIIIDKLNEIDKKIIKLN